MRIRTSKANQTVVLSIDDLVDEIQFNIDPFDTHDGLEQDQLIRDVIAQIPVFNWKAMMRYSRFLDVPGSFTR